MCAETPGASPPPPPGPSSPSDACQLRGPERYCKPQHPWLSALPNIWGQSRRRHSAHKNLRFRKWSPRRPQHWASSRGPRLTVRLRASPVPHMPGTVTGPQRPEQHDHFWGFCSGPTGQPRGPSETAVWRPRGRARVLVKRKERELGLGAGLEVGNPVTWPEEARGPSGAERDLRRVPSPGALPAVRRRVAWLTAFCPRPRSRLSAGVPSCPRHAPSRAGRGRRAPFWGERLGRCHRGPGIRGRRPGSRLWVREAAEVRRPVFVFGIFLS